MAARTELDKPEPVTVPCKVCKEPLVANFHWVYDRWLRPTIHERCVERYKRAVAEAQDKRNVKERAIPERFKAFDVKKFTHPKALAATQAFNPDSQQHILAISGPPGRGKSRLAFATAGDWFDQLHESTGAERWIDCYVGFEALLANFDRATVNQIAMAGFALVDDLGSIDCIGQARALLQAAVRSRVKGNRWTILTIDDFSFDPELENVLKDRAHVVVM